MQAPALKEYATTNNLSFAENEDLPTAREGWIIVPSCENLAASVAAIAFSEFQSGSAGSAESLKAIYVRPSDAEITRNGPTRSSRPAR